MCLVHQIHTLICVPRHWLSLIKTRFDGNSVWREFLFGDGLIFFFFHQHSLLDHVLSLYLEVYKVVQLCLFLLLFFRFGAVSMQPMLSGCLIYFRTAPMSSNYFRPSFMPYWVIIVSSVSLLYDIDLYGVILRIRLEKPRPRVKCLRLKIHRVELCGFLGRRSVRE